MCYNDPGKPMYTHSLQALLAPFARPMADSGCDIHGVYNDSVYFDMVSIMLFQYWYSFNDIITSDLFADIVTFKLPNTHDEHAGASLFAIRAILI